METTKVRVDPTRINELVKEIERLYNDSCEEEAAEWTMVLSDIVDDHMIDQP